MIAAEEKDDDPSYFVLIYGVRADAFEQIADHFGSRLGGIRPSDASRYVSVPMKLASLETNLRWIKTELPGGYLELNLLVCIHAKISWNEIIIPPEIALSAGQHGAKIKILCSQFKFS